jgi:hypothetical protein
VPTHNTCCRTLWFPGWRPFQDVALQHVLYKFSRSARRRSSTHSSLSAGNSAGRTRTRSIFHDVSRVAKIQDAREPQSDEASNQVCIRGNILQTGKETSVVRHLFGPAKDQKGTVKAIFLQIKSPETLMRSFCKKVGS